MICLIRTRKVKAANRKMMNKKKKKRKKNLNPMHLKRKKQEIKKLISQSSRSQTTKIRSILDSLGEAKWNECDGYSDPLQFRRPCGAFGRLPGPGSLFLERINPNDASKGSQAVRKRSRSQDGATVGSQHWPNLIHNPMRGYLRTAYIRDFWID